MSDVFVQVCFERPEVKGAATMPAAAPSAGGQELRCVDFLVDQLTLAVSNFQPKQPAGDTVKSAVCYEMQAELAERQAKHSTRMDKWLRLQSCRHSHNAPC